MDDFLKEALDIVKAQASVRVMSDEEIVTMVRRLNGSLRDISTEDVIYDKAPAENTGDARKSIKEKSVVCLECGKIFKVLTRKHLAMHGLDAAAYKEKWNLKKDTPLVCKSLQRERRKKMKTMRLWEKRRKG